MKTAEDFRKSFGSPDESFTHTVMMTLNELNGCEEDGVPRELTPQLIWSYERREKTSGTKRKENAGKGKRFIRGGLVMAACVVAVFLVVLQTLKTPKNTPDQAVPLQQPRAAVTSLPEVYLTVDPEDLWNAETGIFAEGDTINKAAIPYQNALYKENGAIPRAFHVTVNNIYGETVMDADAFVSLPVSDFSVDMAQKPFILTGNFNMEGQPEYKSFRLSNGGKDSVYTRILNGYNTRLTETAGCSFMSLRWQPVSVYLNGEYWGHYNLSENVDVATVAIHENLDSTEGITVLQGKGILVDGSAEGKKEYEELIRTVKTLDPENNPEDLEYIRSEVDIDNYLEYVAMQMFVGNSDPSVFCCYRVPGGKWKWVWQNVDYGLFASNYDSVKAYLKADGMGVQHIDNTLLLTLLKVPEYKTRFLNRLGEIFRTLTTEKMLETLEPIVAEITPEMQRHFERWAAESETVLNTLMPTEPRAALEYWNDRIERLRNTTRKRPTLFWEFIQENLALSEEDMENFFGPKPEMPADAIL